MSFASDRTRGQGGFPLASMMDIIFLVLIFFVTTSAMRDQEMVMSVKLQATNSGAPAENRTATRITVTEDGTIYIAEQPYTIEQLEQRLRQIARHFPNEAILIRGDKGSKLGTTVQVLDLCQSAGLQNVSIGSRRKAEDR